MEILYCARQLNAEINHILGYSIILLLLLLLQNFTAQN